jgi:lysophospholipase L1-like esterase
MVPQSTKSTATSETNGSETLVTPTSVSPATTTAASTTTTTTTTTVTGASDAQVATPVYYRTVPRQPKKRKTTVLFGTSITKYVREKQLGFRGRKVVNISQSGAKVKDIILNVREFYMTHEAARNDDIEKIIFSFGTNDIKFSKSGVRHLRKYILELVDMTKCLFPTAVILFQCCLPIRCMYPYIARNVLDFNNLLREICFFNNCVYIDCFSSFLTSNFCNRHLYHDWLHLNNKGVGVLSTWLKYIINENSFDRVVNNLIGL